MCPRSGAGGGVLLKSEDLGLVGQRDILDMREKEKLKGVLVENFHYELIGILVLFDGDRVGARFETILQTDLVDPFGEFLCAHCLHVHHDHGQVGVQGAALDNILHIRHRDKKDDRKENGKD